VPSDLGGGSQALNRDVLATLADYAFLPRAAAVEVGGLQTRTLWVKAGNLVGTGSSFTDDRLGEVLAAQGKLDAALIKPIGDAAQARGRRLGELLCEDKLLTHQELATALDDQAQMVFVRALGTSGPSRVITPERGPFHPINRPLAALVVDAFRSSLPLAAVRDVLANAGATGKLIATPVQVQQLALRPAELRQVRELERVPVKPASLAQGSEPLARLLAGLVALKLLD